MAFYDEMAVLVLEMMLINNSAPPFVAYENLRAQYTTCLA